MPGTNASWQELLFLAILTLAFTVGFGMGLNTNPGSLMTAALGIMTVLSFATFVVRIGE